MTAKISNEFIIHDFEATVNGVLKSSKNKPLLEKKGIKIWHEGRGTNLIKIENNEIYFNSIFKFHKSKLGNRQIDIVVSACLDDEQENLQFTYQAKKIKNVPSWLESLLKTNKIAYHSIKIPKKFLFFKDKQNLTELRIAMKTENVLSVYLSVPLDTDKLVLLRKKP